MAAQAGTVAGDPAEKADIGVSEKKTETKLTTKTNYDGSRYQGYQDFSVTYRMDPEFGKMPRYVLQLPLAEGAAFALRSEKLCRIIKLAVASGVDEALDVLLETLFSGQKFQHLEDWHHFFDKDVTEKLFPFLEKDDLAAPGFGSNKEWRSDAQFAAQQISGINPVMISVVKKWEDANQSMNLSANDRVKIEKNLTSGVTLDALIRAKRLFMTDYAIASRLNSVVMQSNSEPPNGRAGKRAVLHSPAVLFWANDDKKLMPLAIQINSGRSLTEAQAKKLSPEEQKYFFEPPDNPSLPHVWHEPCVMIAPPADTKPEDVPMPWLYARTVVMNTDGIIHEGITHLTYTHLAMETIICSMQHCLDPKHKVYKFLEPHMFGTLSINTAARAALIDEKATNFFTQNTSLSAVGVHRAAQLFYHEQWSFEGSALPKALAARGFGSPDGSSEDGLVSDEVSDYFYRDYALQIWKALENYCTEVVDAMYLTDADLAKDPVMAFMYEYMTSDTAEGQLGGKVKGVPPFHEMKTALIAFFTNFIFTASAQHSAVNFGQFAFYGFVPNRPLFLATPFPSKSPSTVTEQFIIDSLPNYSQTFNTIVIARILSLPSDHPIMEAANADTFFGVLGAAIKDHANPFPGQHAKLEAALKIIELEMEKRNQGHTLNSYPVYRWLEPRELASSIAI